MTKPFGAQEIKLFAEEHPEQRVRILYERYEQARRKNAMWCSAEANVRQVLQNLVNYIDSTGDESLAKMAGQQRSRQSVTVA